MSMPASSIELVTAEQLAGLHVPGKTEELVRGQLLVREPPGTRHGSVAARLTFLIADHVYRHNLGVVCSQDTGFKLESDPDTVRAPDVAFISQIRAGQIPLRGYAAVAPDLVVEILSPDDRPGEVLTKVGQWLEAGSSVVWVIDPQRVAARVYRHDGALAIVGADGRLDAEPVLPGFSCALADALR
jgi:Uma2 family endonuclease